MSGNENLKPDKPTVQRLFFALWPSSEIRQQLIAINKVTARHTDGRRVHEDNLHVTLRFLGSVSEEQLPCIEQVANNIKTTPFELVLDQRVFKKKQEMIWLTSDNPLPEPLVTLVNQLEQGVQSCGFAPEKHSYKPHVTLVRKTCKTNRLQDKVKVNWPVDTFVLVSSKTYQEGVEYSVVKEWKL